MKIRMLTTVRPDIPFLAMPGTILRAGETYESIKNRNGAITGICDNGNALGVKPGEFEIVEEGRTLEETKLKLCPFCGGNVTVMHVHHYDFYNRRYFYSCEKCGANIFLFAKEKYVSAKQTDGEAIALWNSRSGQED